MMEDFTQFYFPSSSKRLVYKKGQGPAVVLMHELPGMIPECVDLARRLAENFTVYLPLLFGEASQPFSPLTMIQHTVKICISHEFYCLAKNQSSPITDWLKQLCKYAKEECSGQGVGVIGMCLTGGFVFSLMADENVLASVASQPSLPFGITSEHKAALGVSPEELEVAKSREIPVLALRFSEDKTSPPEKFQTLRKTFGEETEVLEKSDRLCWKRGAILETIEINSQANNPNQIPTNSHAVLTLGFTEESGHPANEVFNRVVDFLKENLQTGV